MKQGILYIVPTPIGNRGDMGQRAIEVLQSVELIAAEDTRHSKTLMMYYGVHTPLQACHEHNEEQLVPSLIEKLQSGKSIALISDAGTPLMSDPGYRLVRAAHQAAIKVSPLPGPCAAITALSASGLPTDRFLFVGFPPHKKSARVLFYENLKQREETLVFYESSHRVVDSVGDMAGVFGGQREIVVARELTKTYETIHRCELGVLQAWLQNDANQQKGEFVLVLHGAETAQDEQSLALQQVLGPLLEELSVKQASNLAARITGQKKNLVYKIALEMKSN